MKYNLYDKLKKQKRLYKILIVIAILSVLIGIIYPLLLDANNKSILSSSVKDLFINVKEGHLDTFSTLKATLTNKLALISIIWLLGISIIGIPIIIILVCYTSFIMGFSFSSIISIFGIKGIISAVLYVFPSSIIEVITTILLSFYAISFSIKLFKFLFLHKNINFSYYMTRYLKILCISLVCFIICSLYSIYVVPKLLKLFTFLTN